MLRTGAFWACIATLAYTYVAYPALSLLRGRLRRVPIRAAPITPSLSVLIAARNEAEVIARKIESVRAADYPAEALEIIVASDGSEDGTVAAARAEGRAIDVLDLPRVGKASALNAAAARASGEILVFTDANSLLHVDALRCLVAPFADDSVGGVAGNQVYRRPGGGGGEGELTYWDIDRRLKAAETSAGNAVSATGALYAVRRSLFRDVPEGVTDDFVTSVGVIAQGRRLVFAPDAIAYEEVAGSRGIEFGRKVRVMTRGLRGVVYMRRLLNPVDHGFYSVQLFTQKVLKRLSVIPNLGLMVLGPLTWRRGGIYRGMAIAEAGVLAAAGIGMRFPSSRIGRLPIFSVPAYFCMANAASLLALRNVITGRRIVRWDTASRGVEPSIGE